MIAKWPKNGQLFSLSISTIFANKSLSSPFYSFVIMCKLRHKRLGHLLVNKLLFKLNSGLLKKSKITLIDDSFVCANCKIGKSKILSFSTNKDATHDFLF